MMHGLTKLTQTHVRPHLWPTTWARHESQMEWPSSLCTGISKLRSPGMRVASAIVLSSLSLSLNNPLGLKHSLTLDADCVTFFLSVNIHQYSRARGK